MAMLLRRLSSRGKSHGGEVTTLDEKMVNLDINKELEKMREEQSKSPVYKVMLLGPGDSGKTTVLKQMKLLHGDGFSAQERQVAKSNIFENVVDSMKKIVQFVKNQDMQFANSDNETHATLIQRYELVKDQKISLDPQIGAAIASLWQEAIIKECYQRGNEFGCPDNANYFFTEIKRISESDYTPINRDILMMRKATTKFSETNFLIRGNQYKVIDVGGQKHYRGTWANFFDDARALIYVASLAGYDQFMEEDPTMNRMKDALKLFGETVNNPHLIKVPVILLLNKTDLAQKKIATSSLRKHFPDLSSKKNEHDFEVMKTYFKFKFEYTASNQQNAKKVYTHFTNSTDTDLMQKIIDIVLDIALNSTLKNIGLV